MYWAADIHIPLYTMNENLLQYILFSINVFYSPFACRVELNPRDVGAGDRGQCSVSPPPEDSGQWTPAPGLTRSATDDPAIMKLHDGRNNVM